MVVDQCDTWGLRTDTTILCGTMLRADPFPLCANVFGVAGIILFASVYLIGCDENLAPREHYDKVPLSIYGVLSPDLDTQSVRIYPLEDFPTLGSSEPLDLDVMSTDLQTGNRTMWRDTILVDRNGQHEYVFWAPFRAEFGHKYRIDVERRGGGATSYAEVRIPSQVMVRIDESDAPLLHVFIEGEEIRVLKPEAEYTVRDARGLGPDTSFFPILRYVFPYHGREEKVEQGWQLAIDMHIDFDELRYLYTGDAELILDRYCFSLILYGGVFDPLLLSRPQTLSNVENGFGFVGGGYRIAPSLFPSREAVESACFVYRR
jgi:hypothetical protein